MCAILAKGYVRDELLSRNLIPFFDFIQVLFCFLFLISVQNFEQGTTGQIALKYSTFSLCYNFISITKQQQKKGDSKAKKKKTS